MQTTRELPATPRLVWTGAAICGLGVVLAGLLDGFTVRVGAYVGGGSAQRILPPVERTYTLLGYGHPRYVAAVAAALVAVAVAAAAWGLRRPVAWVAFAAMVTAAVIGLSLTAAVLGPDNGPSGGVFLSDAVRETIDAARHRPAARDPAFGIVGHSVEPAIGWRLTQGALYALLALSSIALGRAIRPVGWLAVATVAAAIVLVGAVPGANCGGADSVARDPDSNPIGLLAVFAALGCAGLGLGALSRRAWGAGVLALVLGLFGALFAAFFLAARDCAFY